jgi:peptidoglycan/xylan/chitin deacetylase (PgdA/CDA1 family)
MEFILQTVSRLKAGVSQASVSLAESYFRYWPDVLVHADHVPVFMLHRFATPDGRIAGHDPQVLRAAFAFLREHEFVALSLDELCERAMSDSVPPRAVAFTIDDGYEEQGVVGAELFLEHDCPVTFFLATGLTDGTFWPIEAKVAYLLSKLQRRAKLVIEGTSRELDPSNKHELRMLRRAYVTELKNLPIAKAILRVDSASEELGIALPSTPPDTFAPLTWSEARKLEARGVRFGAHTVRHVTLSREDDSTALAELQRSTLRVRAEFSNPSNVFCYPTGRAGDYGQREKQFVHQLGYTAAVTAEEGYVMVPTVQKAPFDLQRFSFPDTLVGFKDIVLQSFRMREQLRRRFRRA